MPWLAQSRCSVRGSRNRSWNWRNRRCVARLPLNGPCSGPNCSYWSMHIPTGIRNDLAVTWASPAGRFTGGENAGRRGTSRWRMSPVAAARPLFPPRDHALIKALACERVAETGEPISRQSLADLTFRAQRALEKPISRSTVWRILDGDAIKPWQYEYWIFPRDPQFSEKAAPILDLYAGHWEGKPLENEDFILSADEKTSIQARRRIHPSLAPGPGRPQRVESEYERAGALQYLAAWDVRRGYVTGRCEATTGIEPFGRLVTQVLTQEPYRSAKRLFWIVDNGSSHRGEAACKRLKGVDARIILVHTPIHASWLNQVEIYFSILQRKVLTPNDFGSLEDLENRIMSFQAEYENVSRPFEWKFTREDLKNVLSRFEDEQKLAA
jgi:hypothetical protein